MPEQNSSVPYDLIVIGSGQGGNPLAAAFAAKGKRVAMIERGAVGGTCVNYGCTPTKTMIASAEVADLARRASEFGVHTGNVDVDMKAVVKRKNELVATSRRSSEKRFEGGAELIRGTASFTGPKQIKVALLGGGERSLTANLIVIDTGLSPAMPRIEGIESVAYLDNVSVMELGNVPEHLLILGGGYIGLEFAQMFRRFGAKVTVLQSGPQLLEQEDPDVADAVRKVLEEDGITIELNARAIAAANSGLGVNVTVESGGESRLIAASHLLLATGRKPNTEHLNLAAAGIKPDQHGYIPVNERLETVVAGVFAVGDAKGGPAFTHVSYDDFRILRANLLEAGSRVTTGRLIPYCVYIDPQLGRVGLTETEAKRIGRVYKAATLPMTSVARATETGQTRGFMKALVDPATYEIIGAAILGAEGGEIVSMLQVAMMAKLPYTALRDAMLAHPTFAESLNSLFMTLDN